MTEKTSDTLSGKKRLIGLAVLLVVMAVSLLIGIELAGKNSIANAAPGTIDPLMFPICGFFIFGLGAGLWGFAILTNCLTFDFSKPFFRAYGKRIWISNIVIGLCVQSGIALMIAPFAELIVARLLPEGIETLASFFLPFIAAQFFFIWFNMWRPLETRTIRKRLATAGLTDEQLASGRVIGISNPDKNSLKKFGYIEEDLGMIWFGEDRIAYRGDSQFFDIPRQDLRDVERKADAGSTASYFGAVYVILHVCQLDGSMRRIRLHAEGQWTQSARARELNTLATLVESWRQNVSVSQGFPIKTVAAG